MKTFVFFASIGGDLAKAAEDTAKQFGWNLHHFIAQVISFCIVAFLLQRFAYKPILQVLEERRKRIADGLANADKIKTELAKTEAARQEILSQANIQANRLIEEARTAASRVLETETQKAVATAEQIIVKAKEAAAQDHARMVAELKREIGHLVAQTTAKVTGKILTIDDQKRLAEETNKQLAA
jgi:F-type H+-transporting ATPase subunit b